MPLVSALLDAGQFDRLRKIAIPANHPDTHGFAMKFFQQPAVLEYLAKTERLRQVVTQEGLDREQRVRQQWLSRLVDDTTEVGKAWQFAETARFVCELLHRDPSATTAVRRKVLSSQPLRDAMIASGQAELLTKLENLDRGP